MIRNPAASPGIAPRHAAGALLAAAALAATGLPDGGQALAGDEALTKVTPEVRLRFRDLPDELFELLDTDHDGRLDRNEAAFDLALRERFGAADTDTDADVDRDEYRAFHDAEVRRLERDERARARPASPARTWPG